MAKPTHPQILLASNLLDGEVMFLGAESWVRDARDALIARDATEAAALEARGKADVVANKVVDVYLAEVEPDAALGPRPLHFRERARLAGPSVRRDLGKQARAGKVGS
ncbi:DUF2849 domain-containing protein [Methylocystis bryophila]|uniref:DUF2849 domain-containing protein n=1 Tax=Methylocystis bryophila TaxID=655015 RepID=A0A1W6MZ16_9HYPH|nr:DUF2849 domain-containing protein [Methylocystis bryophila]ARN82840.1 hypothetical protein B1812_19090 [Methylocystis bryophila]BDV39098.1 hypothetical protein DSM21852_23510 [Methylocystis bryophila]